MTEELADAEEIERIWSVRWRDPAWAAGTADAIAGFAVWLPNIPLREAGLLFVPRRTSVGSWSATMEDLAAYLYPLIVAGKHHQPVLKALERLGYVIQRIEDATLHPRGPWWYLLEPLLNRFFLAGTYVNPRAFLPFSAYRVLESWPDGHPFEREEMAFTAAATELVKPRLALLGESFEFTVHDSLCWSRFSSTLVRSLLPHLEKGEPAARQILAGLLVMIRAAERRDVGRYRATTLGETLLDTWHFPQYDTRDGDFLYSILPEFAPLFSDIRAAREDQRRMEEGGY